MAVLETPLGSTLRITLETDFDDDGKPILKNRNFRNVKPNAANQDVFDIANLLVSLQQHTLNAVLRIDEVHLGEE
ncbi:MAG: DUF1659 domain-containing protein [Syntrophomonadaceae bacterium]|nr:DUF1659 domain-containing protein [Syntrophomonadaceae bacterium]